MLYTVISSSCPSFSHTSTLGDFCLPEGSLIFPPHGSCGRSPTDALCPGASRKVFLCPRLTSSPDISCHHFIHPCIKPAPPAPPGAAPPPSAAPGRRGAERPGARRRRAELSGCPRSPRLGNWAVGEAARAGLYRSPCWWFETLSASLATRRRRERGAGARRGAGSRDEALPALSASARGTHGARTRSLT
ncbi:CLK4-associating serine/arginine rich protein-like [Mustela erminea]|uniref:CLK4-associating serine/arginine rich protein-like n=1 Tax=Mustela erminea TaxID=36723 RepID=UPI0013870F71|nr:CLK4-associating serine/arginine rich protein-like [Mustela erminea]